MAASLSFWLYHERIAKRAMHTLQFAHAAKSPAAALVSARPRSHRLRFGFLLAHAYAYCHATQKSCTVRPVHCHARQVAPTGGTRRKSAALDFLIGEPHSDRNENIAITSAHARLKALFTPVLNSEICIYSHWLSDKLHSQRCWRRWIPWQHGLATQ